MKYGVVTTFPNAAWDVYAKQMLASFRANWNCPILVVLDDDTLLKNGELTSVLNVHPEDSACISDDPEKKAFLERNVGKDDPMDYRKQPVRFSHKVFAMESAVHFFADKIDYLIWLDADVITKAPVTENHIKEWAPAEGQIASFLGRKDWSASETGLLVFRVGDATREFIRSWKRIYTSDEILSYPELTDAFAFDGLRSRFNEANKKELFRNLSEGLPGRDVFEASPLGQVMEHYKGNRKKQVAPIYTKKAVQHSNAMHGNQYDVKNMNIQTKNCVPDDTIKENVSMNLRIIDKWITENSLTDEEVVICSAGPSLSVDEIMPYYRRGVKIVAVKHALQKLLDAGITPWACVLLDPRGHVADFVQYPNRKIKWFVASMVDPRVTQHLIDYGCDVYGYHAVVGADEITRVPRGHILLGGGSATATRGISLLYTLGFRKMHLFGYDCCYFKKPDLNEKKDNGRLRFEEVTLTAQSWGNRTEVRTFWTEGQFLAQVQEMDKIYLENSELQLNIYGDGIIPWMFKHQQKLKAWKAHEKEKRHQAISGNPDINQWLSSNGTR